ncbi:hypothetical protein Mal4_39520 [Maioricimonas rarisocia]|uniref:Uncharacterized protein n=1 Tax=Maioricimonas rarisocia TaxID=2528026 RepID=A0A517ZAS5_9PLAN|nr:hypothetical protein Mal4_39520 [Maioricimonas rarisocia]
MRAEPVNHLMLRHEQDRGASQQHTAEWPRTVQRREPNGVTGSFCAARRR